MLNFLLLVLFALLGLLLNWLARGSAEGAGDTAIMYMLSALASIVVSAILFIAVIVDRNGDTQTALRLAVALSAYGGLAFIKR